MIQERESRRHRGLKVFVLLCALMIIALPAMAAKGGNGATGGGGKGHGGGGTTGTGGGTITLKMVTDANGNGAPNYGDQVTYNISTTASEPRVELLCYQNKVMVLDAVTGFYASYPWPWTQVMTLSSQSWTSGAGECTATLYSWDGWTRTILATPLSFHVDA